MKKLIPILLLFAALPSFALVPEMHLYLRAGTGSNLRGGAQECVRNSGSWGNEFRLGNECEIYGEMSFQGDILKAESETAPYWKFFSNFAFAYNNHTDWEAPNANNWVLREVYSEGGRVDGLDFHVWVGKRFYRWGDLHMMDFYPMSMSGPGGGIGGLNTSWGSWAFAVIQNAKSDEIMGTGAVATKVGKAAKTTFHVRLDNSPSPIGSWSYWLVGGTTPATTDQADTQDYKAGSGALFAAKNNWSSNGLSNEFGLGYGNGVMSNFGPDGDLVKDCVDETDPACQVAGSWRARAWDSLTWETEKWSTQAAVIYDELDLGTSQNNKVRWTSIGIRPTRWITDHISIAFQAGTSTVEDDRDGAGARTLRRYTIAPQLSMSKGFYSRPVLRAYYSRTEWNDANRVSVVGTSFANETSQDAFGFQTEVWF